MTHRRGRLVAAAGLALACVAAAASCNRSTEATPAKTPEGPPPATNPSGAVTFPVPEDTAAVVKVAGLQLMPQDAPTEHHLRSHVDVIIDGKAVVVPADIGVDVPGKQISPLHTTDDSGIVHIDAAKKDPPDTYRVGQLFQEWAVPLDKTCIATYCVDATHQLLGFSNGQLVPDPASIPFAADAQVTIWYGPKGTNPTVPVSYAFPS
jgi:hypothetical protein